MVNYLNQIARQKIPKNTVSLILGRNCSLVKNKLNFIEFKFFSWNLIETHEPNPNQLGPFSKVDFLRMWFKWEKVF